VLLISPPLPAFGPPMQGSAFSTSRLTTEPVFVHQSVVPPTMPRNRKEKSATHQSSAHSQVLIPIDCSNSGSTAVYPSVYYGGCVDRILPHEPEVTLTSIVCQTECGHLSPEVFHIRTAEFISRVLRVFCVGAALPGSGYRYGPCSLGSTLVRGGSPVSIVIRLFLSYIR